MIAIVQDGKVWTLRLERAEKANALTAAMLRALSKAVENANDAGAAVLILTGQGRVFSAGADLSEMQAGLGGDPVWQQVSGAIASFPGLTVAALNGSLAGGAMGLALACDIRIAVPDADFFYPVMRLGFLPQPSDPGRLSALIGPGRARMLLLAGQRIGAAEALNWGLIDRIVAADALLEVARDLGRDAVGAAPAHRAALTRMMR